jgi:hypothetical protein
VLAGRFVVARTSLVALPAGPVGGLDLTCGEPISLAFGPATSDAAVLVSRIERWNALSLAGCQPIRGLHWHRGRPLLAWSPTVLSPHEAPGSATSLPLDQLATIGEALDDAGLGLPAGAGAIAFGGVAGAYLRLPAVWPAEPARPLARRLPADAALLLAGRLALPAEPPPARLRVARARARAAPSALRSRRARIALVASAGLCSAVVASIAVGGTHATPTANGAPVVTVPAVSARVVSPAPASTRQAPQPRPIARGGAARILLEAPRTAHRTVVVVARPAPHPRAARSGGWVEGLFVGQ